MFCLRHSAVAANPRYLSGELFFPQSFTCIIGVAGFATCAVYLKRVKSPLASRRKIVCRSRRWGRNSRQRYWQREMIFGASKGRLDEGGPGSASAAKQNGGPNCVPTRLRGVVMGR